MVRALAGKTNPFATSCWAWKRKAHREHITYYVDKTRPVADKLPLKPSWLRLKLCPHTTERKNLPYVSSSVLAFRLYRVVEAQPLLLRLGHTIDDKSPPP